MAMPGLLGGRLGALLLTTAMLLALVLSPSLAKEGAICRTVEDASRPDASQPGLMLLQRKTRVPAEAAGDSPKTPLWPFDLFIGKTTTTPAPTHAPLRQHVDEDSPAAANVSQGGNTSNASNASNDTAPANASASKASNASNDTAPANASASKASNASNDTAPANVSASKANKTVANDTQEANSSVANASSKKEANSSVANASSKKEICPVCKPLKAKFRLACSVLGKTVAQCMEEAVKGHGAVVDGMKRLGASKRRIARCGRCHRALRALKESTEVANASNATNSSDIDEPENKTKEVCPVCKPLAKSFRLVCSVLGKPTQQCAEEAASGGGAVVAGMKRLGQSEQRLAACGACYRGLRDSAPPANASNASNATEESEPANATNATKEVCPVCKPLAKNFTTACYILGKSSKECMEDALAGGPVIKAMERLGSPAESIAACVSCHNAIREAAVAKANSSNATSAPEANTSTLANASKNETETPKAVCPMCKPLEKSFNSVCYILGMPSGECMAEALSGGSGVTRGMKRMGESPEAIAACVQCHKARQEAAAAANSTNATANASEAIPLPADANGTEVDTDADSGTDDEESATGLDADANHDTDDEDGATGSEWVQGLASE